MHSQSSIDSLANTTKNVIKSLDEQNDEENMEQLNSMREGFGQVESRDAQLQSIRSELRDLITVDSRIRQCQQMSREIEEFE